ncbi:hypothetical protein E2C01_032937 [Portunus trituberculatus]|uniref:Uncharacterized protein n=1 Tax=Portunus trituberculatus TaxID=210409 RepID=A0A5B7EYT1_PORTR|nr:hypothetical protein [Portunus trituberculatus]
MIRSSSKRLVTCYSSLNQSLNFHPPPHIIILSPQPVGAEEGLALQLVIPTRLFPPLSLRTPSDQLVTFVQGRAAGSHSPCLRRSQRVPNSVTLSPNEVSGVHEEEAQ